jgi:hypothetical protein
VFVAVAAHAAPVRVLLVFGKNVSDDVRETIESAVASEAEAVDANEYARLSREKGLVPHGDAALERVAPHVQAQLIISAHKSGGKLVITYRDGGTGEVLRKDSLPDRRRGAAAARLHSRLRADVRRSIASVAATSVNQAAAAAPEPIQELSAESEAAAQPSTADEAPQPALPQETSDLEAERFLFELSAGVGGATRNSVVPTRLGVHKLDTGLFVAVSLGMRLTTPLGGQWLVRASADYRTSLGLQGTQMQREIEMSTPLRSHAASFGVAPGYRFAAADSISVLLHLGWYFRGLRPIAQLALPEVSWHAAVVRPELNISLAHGVVTLRLAPELLVIAGLYTTLPDESGLAHTGMAYGGEASIDVQLAALVGLRIEYRESHAAFRTAWSENLSDIERFCAVRIVLSY